MKAPLFRSKAAAGDQAFSLVEVVMALGIVSFGLISMVGMLGIGLKNFHDAVNATTEAEITQKLANELQLASYSSLTNSTATNYYFTQEGLVTNATSAVYSALVSAPTKLTVPGAGSTDPSDTLNFTIWIWSQSSPQSTNVVSVYIANNGS